MALSCSVIKIAPRERYRVNFQVGESDMNVIGIGIDQFGQLLVLALAGEPFSIDVAQVPLETVVVF